MATTVAHRAVQNQPFGLLRFSLNFVRNLSTASPSTQNPSASSPAAKKPKRRKKKNLFEVAQFLPKWGIGYHMAKTHWTNVSYQITKINLYKDGRHGKAWGIAHKDVLDGKVTIYHDLSSVMRFGKETTGLAAADASKKISGVHKRCWRYIPHLSKAAEITPNLMKLTENATKAEAQVT